MNTAEKNVAFEKITKKQKVELKKTKDTGEQNVASLIIALIYSNYTLQMSDVVCSVFFVEFLNQYMKHVHNVNNFIKINVACGIGFKMNRTPSKKQLCLSMHRGKNQCNNKVVSCDKNDSL